MANIYGQSQKLSWKWAQHSHRLTYYVYYERFECRGATYITTKWLLLFVKQLQLSRLTIGIERGVFQLGTRAGWYEALYWPWEQADMRLCLPTCHESRLIWGSVFQLGMRAGWYEALYWPWEQADMRLCTGTNKLLLVKHVQQWTQRNDMICS